MNGAMTDRLKILFGGFIVCSVLFLPDLHLKSSWPAIQVIDFLLPILAIYVFIERKQVQGKLLFIGIGVFAVIMLLSMAVNGRIFVIQDLFEIFKLVKFSLIVAFFTLVPTAAFGRTWLKPMFIALVGFNLLHFFNLFDFNDIIATYYNGGLHIEYFGLNSLKEPAVKRMVGLAGNPNINALVFLFFSIAFLPIKQRSNTLWWFFVAVLMVFLCQSRTAILGLGAILFAAGFLMKKYFTLRKWTIIVLGISAVYLLSWAMATDFFRYSLYSNNLFNGQILQTGSARGRWEAWTLLGEMILQKPLLGYGGNKAYFYAQKIYSENEYILMAWRYGMIGLLGYLLIYLLPLKAFFQAKKIEKTYPALLCLVLMSVAALTNNPFVDRTIMVLFAAVIGAVYAQLSTEKIHVE
jgi:O-antigen ligase